MKLNNSKLVLKFKQNVPFIKAKVQETVYQCATKKKKEQLTTQWWIYCKNRSAENSWNTNSNNSLTFLWCRQRGKMSTNTIDKQKIQGPIQTKKLHAPKLRWHNTTLIQHSSSQVKVIFCKVADFPWKLLCTAAKLRLQCNNVIIIGINYTCAFPWKIGQHVESRDEPPYKRFDGRAKGKHF